MQANIVIKERGVKTMEQKGNQAIMFEFHRFRQRLNAFLDSTPDRILNICLGELNEASKNVSDEIEKRKTETRRIHEKMFGLPITPESGLSLKSLKTRIIRRPLMSTMLKLAKEIIDAQKAKIEQILPEKPVADTTEQSTVPKEDERAQYEETEPFSRWNEQTPGPKSEVLEEKKNKTEAVDEEDGWTLLKDKTPNSKTLVQLTTIRSNKRVRIIAHYNESSFYFINTSAKVEEEIVAWKELKLSDPYEGAIEDIEDIETKKEE